jgi:two-component system chemotaxis response regulator CheY
VVDDSRAMRAYVRGALKTRFDCEIVEISSGFEALRLLARESFDLVITDVNMPDINGLELTRFVRESARLKELPLLIISTQTTAPQREKALEQGANAYVTKPFEPETLAAAVEECLGGAGDDPTAAEDR